MLNHLSWKAIFLFGVHCKFAYTQTTTFNIWILTFFPYTFKNFRIFCTQESNFTMFQGGISSLRHQFSMFFFSGGIFVLGERWLVGLRKCWWNLSKTSASFCCIRPVLRVLKFFHMFNNPLPLQELRRLTRETNVCVKMVSEFFNMFSQAAKCSF